MARRAGRGKREEPLTPKRSRRISPLRPADGAGQRAGRGTTVPGTQAVMGVKPIGQAGFTGVKTIGSSSVKVLGSGSLRPPGSKGITGRR